MEHLIEFIMRHPVMVGIFVVLVALFFFMEMRKGGASITSQMLVQLANKENAFILDIRKVVDFNKGHITNSQHIPHEKIESRLNQLSKYKDQPIIIVDALGQHSGSSGKLLKEKGFHHVMRLKGGINSWQADGLPLVKK